VTPGDPSARAAQTRNDLTGSLAAVIAASLFGMLGPITRLAGDAGVPGIAMTAWRALLGVLFLTVVLLVTRQGGSVAAALRALSRHGRAMLATAAITGFVLNAAMFTAFGLAPVALVLMMFYTYPAGVALVDVVTGHERLTRWRAAALLLSMGGVVLVLAGGAPAADAAPNAIAGILLGLLASAAQVVFVTASRSGYRAVPAAGASLVIMASSVAGAVVVALVAGQGAGLLVPLSTPKTWPLILLAGVAAAGISSWLFLISIRRIGGTRAGILMLFEPVVGVILAALILGESMTPAQLAGTALVLVGALVLQRGSEPDLEPVVETAAGPVL
jgi:drug/metabolite transporter (DMT)-like permease